MKIKELIVFITKLLTTLNVVIFFGKMILGFYYSYVIGEVKKYETTKKDLYWQKSLLFSYMVIYSVNF